MACCPKTYWCTPDGPIGVEADDDGIYTPPDGATDGPFATEDEAGKACPYSICDPPFEVPAGGFIVSIVDQGYTGPVSPASPPPWPDNSYPLDNYAVSPDSVAISSDPLTFDGQTDAAKILVGFSCNPESACGSSQIMVQLAFVGLFGGTPTADGVFSSSNGWTLADGGVTGVSWWKCFAAADIVFPLDVGTVTYDIYFGTVPPVVAGPYTVRVIIDVA